jgi:hypothetical protein
MEEPMLSPHEFAALLFVKYSPDQLHMKPAQLHTLLELELVRLEELPSGNQHWRLTESGHSAMRIMNRIGSQMSLANHAPLPMASTTIAT